MKAVGGVIVALAVAFRRRWPLRGMVVVLAVLLARALIGDVNSSQQPVGVMPSLILMIYGLGAFAAPQRSQWVLAFLVLI